MNSTITVLKSMQELLSGIWSEAEEIKEPLPAKIQLSFTTVIEQAERNL